MLRDPSLVEEEDDEGPRRKYRGVGTHNVGTVTR